MRSALKLAITAGVTAALTVSVAGPAFGDPPTGVTPAAKDIVGVGSDTTQFFMDQIALNYDNKSPAPTRKVYSWDATGDPATITTKTGATPIARPDGSSAGIGALNTNTIATVDFARSSRGRGGSDPSSVNFVAFAKDAVTVATRASTNAPSKSFSTSQIQAIYTCSATTWKQVGGSSTATIKPFLPQSGSGTRSFFETAIGLTDAQIGPCVTQGVQENEGIDPVLDDPNAIYPYSVAKYIAQAYHSSGTGANDFGTDDHGQAKLHILNGTSPTSGTGAATKINPNFSPTFQRTVYNVVRADNSTSDGIPAYLHGVFGAGGYICAQTKVIKAYGFLPINTCGAVS